MEDKPDYEFEGAKREHATESKPWIEMKTELEDFEADLRDEWRREDSSRSLVDFLFAKLEKQKARDAQTLKFCDEALSDLPKGDCYKTIYAITKIKKLLV